MVVVRSSRARATLRDCASGCGADDLELTTSFAPKNDQHEAVRAFLKKDACAAVAAVASQFEAEFVSFDGRRRRARRPVPQVEAVPTPEAEVDERRVAAESTSARSASAAQERPAKAEPRTLRWSFDIAQYQSSVERVAAGRVVASEVVRFRWASVQRVFPGR